MDIWEFRSRSDGDDAIGRDYLELCIDKMIAIGRLLDDQ